MSPRKTVGQAVLSSVRNTVQDDILEILEYRVWDDVLQWASCDRNRRINPDVRVGANPVFALERERHNVCRERPAQTLEMRREARGMLEIHAGRSQEVQ
jgi:hypothetical protein